MDESSLERLIRTHEDELGARLGREMPRRHAGVLSVEDVLQQTWIDASLGFETLVSRSDRAVRAWLWSIARRNLIDAIRMLDAERRGGGRRMTPLRSIGSGSLRWFARSTPSRRPRALERNRALYDAIGELPERYRRVVEGFDLQGRAMGEIASELGTSPGAAYMMRARAHRVLRERLGRASLFFSGSA